MWLLALILLSYKYYYIVIVFVLSVLAFYIWINFLFVLNIIISKTFQKIIPFTNSERKNFLIYYLKNRTRGIWTRDLRYAWVIKSWPTLHSDRKKLLSFGWSTLYSLKRLKRVPESRVQLNGCFIITVYIPLNFWP